MGWSHLKSLLQLFKCSYICFCDSDYFINHYGSKKYNKQKNIFHPLEVVSRYSVPQLQVFYLRPNICTNFIPNNNDLTSL